jgi:hypothetical protein
LASQERPRTFVVSFATLASGRAVKDSANRAAPEARSEFPGASRGFVVVSLVDTTSGIGRLR